MKTIFLIIALAITLIANSQDDTSKVKKYDFKGYVSFTNSNSFDSISKPWYIDNQFYNRLNFNYYHKSSTFNLQMRNRLIYGNTMLLYPNYGKTIGSDQGIMDLSFNLIDQQNLIFNLQFDRLNYLYSKDKIEFQLGRQRVNWGTTMVWNPNDIFNAYSYFDFDYEEKPGSDAIRFEYHTGAASSIEIAAKVDSSENITAAAKWLINKWNYDFQLIAGEMNQTDYVGGLAWAGNIWKLGFKGEASYFLPIDDTIGNVLEASVSLDYAFSNNLFIMAQVLYCDFGNENPIKNFNSYYSSTLNAKYMSFTDWNIFLQASYPINPLLSASFAAMYYPEIEGYFINPMITYSLSQNIDAAFLIQYFKGKFPNAFGVTQNQQVNMAFMRLKWSF